MFVAVDFSPCSHQHIGDTANRPRQRCALWSRRMGRSSLYGKINIKSTSLSSVGVPQACEPNK